MSEATERLERNASGAAAFYAECEDDIREVLAENERLREELAIRIGKRLDAEGDRDVAILRASKAELELAEAKRENEQLRKDFTQGFARVQILAEGGTVEPYTDKPYAVVLQSVEELNRQLAEAKRAHPVTHSAEDCEEPDCTHQSFATCEQIEKRMSFMRKLLDNRRQQLYQLNPKQATIEWNRLCDALELPDLKEPFDGEDVLRTIDGLKRQLATARLDSVREFVAEYERRKWHGLGDGTVRMVSPVELLAEWEARAKEPGE